jgi:hypothetical protein
MFIDWKYTCFVCDHPIQPRICTDTAYEFLAYYDYRHIYNPIPLYMNLMYYKFMDKRVRRVCFYCFQNYKKPSVHALRERETGRVRIRPYISQSIPREALVKWIEEMREFMYPSQTDAP